MADSNERRDRMFPRLTEAQIERVSNVGTRRKVEAGAVVFEVGDRDTAFFVVLAGELEVLRPLVSGDERVVVHGRGEFTGEVNVLSGPPRARARRACARPARSSPSTASACAASSRATPSSATSSCARSSCGAWGSCRAGRATPCSSARATRRARCAAGVPHAQRAPLRVRRRRARPRRAGAARSLPRRRRGRAHRHLPRRHVLKNPTNEEVARDASGSARRSTRRRCAISSSWARGRPGWRPPSTPRPRGSTCSCSRPTRPAARPARARRSRTTSASRRASRARRSPGAPSRRRRSSAPRSPSPAPPSRFDCATPKPLRDHPRRRRGRAHARAHHRGQRRRSTGASPCRPLALRRRGRLLRRVAPRGAALRRRGGHRRRRRQLGRARRRSSCRSTPRHVHVLVRGAGLAETHVALPHPAHRGAARTSRSTRAPRSSRSRATTGCERVRCAAPDRAPARTPPSATSS